MPPYIQTLLDDNGENLQDHIKTPNGIDVYSVQDVITPEMYDTYTKFSDIKDLMARYKPNIPTKTGGTVKR